MTKKMLATGETSTTCKAHPEGLAAGSVSAKCSPSGHGWPPVGEVRRLPDGRSAYTLNTRKRTQAPGSVIASSKLGTKDIDIVAQGQKGEWMVYATKHPVVGSR